MGGAGVGAEGSVRGLERLIGGNVRRLGRYAALAESASKRGATGRQPASAPPSPPQSPPPAPPQSPPASTAARLAANENPFGASPRALAAMARCLCEAHRYPEAPGSALCQALARHHGVTPDMVVCANGAANMLTAIAQALLDPGDEVIVPAPGFVTYTEVATLMGARVVEVPLRDYSIDLDGMAAAAAPRTKIVYLASPHNPTGTIVRRGDLERFLGRLSAARAGGGGAAGGPVVVIDEAYAEYVDDPEYPRGADYVRGGDPVVVVRSFSKVYGLAGIRFGYAIAPAALTLAFAAAREWFCVNRVAEAGALAALGDQEHVARCQDLNRAGRQRLTAGLAALGARVVPSQANFVLADVGADADRLRAALRERGVLVCSGRQWGLPTMIRVSVGLEWEVEAFLAALREALAAAGSGG